MGQQVGRANARPTWSNLWVLVLVSICTINAQEERFNAGSTTCLCSLWKPDTPTGDASHGLSVYSRPDISSTSRSLRGARRGPARGSRSEPKTWRGPALGWARQLYPV